MTDREYIIDCAIERMMELGLNKLHPDYKPPPPMESLQESTIQESTGVFNMIQDSIDSNPPTNNLNLDSARNNYQEDDFNSPINSSHLKPRDLMGEVRKHA